MIDIEEIIVEYLSDNLEIPVAADVPEIMPDEFISLELTGGGFGDIILDYPTVAIQCWAETRTDAKNLARKVDRLLRKICDSYYDISSAERNSLYNFPDPQSRKARYQIVFDFIVQQ